MFNVIDSTLCPICLEGDSNKVGRVWKRVDSTTGLTEVHNEALGKELLKKTCFSEEELDALAVPELKYTNFIKVETMCLDIDGDKTKKYFVPVDTHESVFSDAVVQSLRPRDVTKYLSAMKVISVILYEFQYPPFISCILDIVVRGLLANRDTEPRTSNILKQKKSGWILLLNIYRDFVTSHNDRLLFDRVVSSYSLVRQIWDEKIPQVSDLYGAAPRKRKREESEFGEYLRQSDSYSHYVYQYFFAPTHENDPKLPKNSDNPNLQYLTGQVNMQYSDISRGRRNCKSWIGDMLHRSLPRNMIKENFCLYTPICENGHQVCVECALLLKNNGNTVSKCPQCKADTIVKSIDSDQDLLMADMNAGPVLYIKFFQFELPFYITIVNCTYSKNHPFLRQFTAYERKVIQDYYNYLPSYGEAPEILTGKIIQNSPFMNSFDIKCHHSAKVSVRLYTARTAIAPGFTIGLRKIYSMTLNNNNILLESEKNGTPVDNKIKYVPEPEDQIMQLDGNCCILLNELNIGIKRWNTSLEIVFRGPDGLVIQTAAINIDKRANDEWHHRDHQITNERSCTLQRSENPYLIMEEKLLGDVYDANGQKIPV